MVILSSCGGEDWAHFDCVVVSAKPLHNIQAGSNMQTVTGYKPEQVSALNEKEVRWGALREIDEMKKYGPKPPTPPTEAQGDVVVEKRVEDSAIPLLPLTDDQRQEIILSLKHSNFIVCF
jgi:hypothetical protein